MEVQEIKDLLRSKGYFVQNLWQTEYVQQVATDHHEIELTFDECIQVFDYIGETFDAEIGMNWDTISEAIRTLFGDRIG